MEPNIGSDVVWPAPPTTTTFCSGAKLSTFCFCASLFDLSELNTDEIFLVRSVEKNRSISQSRSKIASLDEDFSEIVGFSAFYFIFYYSFDFIQWTEVCVDV